ncbi:zeta toxin family protein [Streptomyces sp. NPDC058274]|uniref:zeta toxin family protein n=1 Tax=Streptomyces sp. NPDC058274 TaxID=3346416 RepID=UPI0036EA6F13
MSGPDVERHLLPEAENRRIFLDRIVPQQFAGRVPQETPTVVFLVGQPGAGKTRVGHMLAEVLNKRGGFIDVDSDLYKPFHPEYDRLMQQDDKLMAAYTRADGRKWMAQAHEYVRDTKLNAVIQETSQDGEAVAATMRAYRDSGFRVEVVAMGVSEALSNQGIVHRYHEQVKERGSGRLTVQANADQSYEGIVDLARRVDAHRLADEVTVFRRGEGEPRYANRLGADGQWEQTPALAPAIEAERGRRWSAGESGDFLQVQGKLHTEMSPDWAAPLARIDRLAQPHLAPLTKLSDQDLQQQVQRAGEALQRGSAAAAPRSVDGLSSRSAERGAKGPETGQGDPAPQQGGPSSISRAAGARSQSGHPGPQAAEIRTELQRRSELSPAQRGFENVGRQHAAAATPAQSPRPGPPAAAPHIPPPRPQRPSPGR